MHLLREGRGIATILLWSVYFMNPFNLYSLSNWLPTVVRGAGYSTSTAVLVGTILQLGGLISPFLMAWLVLRKGFIPVLAATFLICAGSVALIGQPGLSLPLLVGMVFITGACVAGVVPSVNALCAMTGITIAMIPQPVAALVLSMLAGMQSYAYDGKILEVARLSGYPLLTLAGPIRRSAGGSLQPPRRSSGQALIRRST